MLIEMGSAALLCAPFSMSVDDGCVSRADSWHAATRYDLFLNMAAAGVCSYGKVACVRISPAGLQSLVNFQPFEATNSSGLSVVVDAPNLSARSPQSLVREIKRLSGLTWENIAEVVGVSPRSVHLWLSGGQMAETKRQRAGLLLSFLTFIDRGHGEANRALILDTSDAGTTVLVMLTAGEHERAKMIVGPGRPRPSPFASTARNSLRRTAPDHFGLTLDAYGTAEIVDIEPSTVSGKRRVAARRKGA